MTRATCREGGCRELTIRGSERCDAHTPGDAPCHARRERVRSVDFETHLFRPGHMAPKPVCLSWAEGHRAGIETGPKMGRMLREVLEAEVLLVGWSVSFDFAVALQWMPDLAEKIFAAYSDDRVCCLLVAEKLLDIAEGRHMRWGGKGQYMLGAVAKRRLKQELDKGDDSWRTRYAELEGVPVEEWPADAVRYSLEDARAPLKLLANQARRAEELRYDLPDAFDQTRADLVLRLCSMWGARTDSGKVRELVQRLELEMAPMKEKLERMGLYKDGHKSKKALQAIVTEATGGNPPRTPKGNVKTDAETLEDMEHDERAVTWVEFSTKEKRLGTVRSFAPLMHSRFNVLVDSGRTSSSGDDKIPGTNMQNLPREPGARECFVARKGRVLVSCDYDSQELRTLAQCCLLIVGFSRLAERYVAEPTFDPHTAFAALGLLGIPEEEALRRKKSGDAEVKEARQHAKIGNFGLPGGMGVWGLIRYARGYGQRWAEPASCPGCAHMVRGGDVRSAPKHECRARRLRDAWFRQWPEMDGYFRFVKDQVGRHGEGSITQLISRRMRGRVGFTDGANTLFQGLAADASKAALWEIGRRCYSVPSSALYGSRPWNFIHDEPIIESPEDVAADAALEMRDVMVEAMGLYTPDIPVRATPVLMRSWRKGAEPKFRDGRLVPVEDAT